MKKLPCSLKKISGMNMILASSLLAAVLSTWTPAARANLVLQSPTVMVEQSEGEGTMLVQNKADSPMLMHVDVVNVPEDQEDLILVAPPITRLDSGDTQLVRFILKDPGTIKTERFKRATFEGIPKSAANSVQIALRQNIGLVIRPAGLTPNDTPWKLLKWRNTAQGLSVENPSPYIVRMLEGIKLLPAGTELLLSKNYLLPGEKITLPSHAPLTDVQKVSFQPASINGFIKATHEATVE
ncbi:fimbria/pilus chaperone family protein [Herbaspirillum sp. RTI4]|uniref:fimbria/pilus chaperone family protein n=1 Tax=Herbaspirillum sp. RTI4 TaxID=3048640 RepID=UPI002AB48F35|nr:fimbria/pilus chaperone family protein [Herbaspirillum sp. RTI4]MDY7577735.1 fimbria/pilus chaperone family protein [Herbaspirillum sp. RTI4]MEA9980837.1 fimbria/pilus chaperone family protein [Herbaspirillum sp. RTI4]